MGVAATTTPTVAGASAKSGSDVGRYLYHYHTTRWLTLSLGASYVSSQFLRGDAANVEPPSLTISSCVRASQPSGRSSEPPSGSTTS